ncbi:MULTISPECIES: CPBP family intramembrane glutamic endopeptidase [Bacillus]|uniref:CPBP family intramembrane glutamic endopeptidase n=1 Tax=Bacillus TaxID=1386 RepID=UPI000330F2BC|nr:MULTISPECIES: CPBP family intramembrane glutamic endopeptidase [Bacillus]EOO12393.1 hypothetical protein IG9_05495 [Bacillus cereus HuA2-9]MBK5491140.1 CPBP family intramembrane metalloprotease [Bacillus sp. TH17]MBK5491189.1 CPBP family intramembrane metalloprotease [Bacillus sp. TH17]MEE3950252.1 CPBP family intramembrane glutamic endopeptidase [Bacillus wiedmannii]
MKTILFEKRPFLEMVIFVVAMLVSTFFIPQIKGLVFILPIVYFLIERMARKRTRESIGFNRKNILSDLKHSWPLVILVGVILQVIYFLLYKNIFPEVLDHVLERADFIEAINGNLLFTLLILALGEEITFRGLVQGRLNWLIKPVYSILLSSIIFTLMHISIGNFIVVLIDLITVFIDSMIFGVIFYKTKNIYISWIAHASANIVAVLLMMTI